MLNTIKSYNSNEIDKSEYVKKMYSYHNLLFEYKELLKTNIVSEIIINKDKLIAKFKDPEISMIINEHDHRIAPIESLNFNNYEGEETRLILELISEDFSNNYNILDIGANIGWYSLAISKYFPKSTIHSFEPIPSTFRFLTKNIKLNNFKNIKLNNFGFSNEDKDISFYYYKEGSGNSSLMNLADSSDVSTVSSRVMKLDNYMKTNNHSLDFIKCDVEGAEFLVFQGGVEAIKKNKPIVFSEMLRKYSLKFNYHPNEIITFFKDLGYICYVIKNNKLSLFELMDDNTIETNFIFLHKTKHSKIINTLNN